jgi:hypothetical protein
MNQIELLYHLDNLRECDPNYVVDVLGITSEQLVNDYLDLAIKFIEEDQGE